MPNNKLNMTDAKSHPIWCMLFVVIFLLRIFPWAISEYWYDEVLTIVNFSGDPLHQGIWKSVFRHYLLANNHILNSAVSFILLKFLPGGIEFLQRLPSILFGVATILLISIGWKKHLGWKTALFGGCIFAISPVTTAYAWQLRGYSMSIFFGTMAMTGVLRASKSPKLGILLTSLTCLILPLVIPSNAMLAPVAAAGLMIQLPTWRSRITALLCTGISAALGLSYYLTIWSQFKSAMAEPDGWTSVWLLVGALAAGLTVHVIGLIPAYIKSGRQSLANLRLPITLASASIAVAALVILLAQSGHAPYPRVFLVLFPAITLAVLLPLKDFSFSLKPTILMTFACGGIISVYSDNWTTQALISGTVPDNLLCQYYRGATELRETASIMLLECKKDTYVLTDPYDFPAMQFYRILTEGNAENVMPSNRFPQVPETGDCVIVARTTEDFHKICEVSGLAPEDFQPFKKLEIRTIYRRKDFR